MTKTPVIIDQRYEIIKPLGSGMSGDVILVKDEEGIKALKFLKKVQMNVSREDALANFKNEFSILKELNHPNISRILDFGYETKMRKYYITTEFIEGAELHEACEEQPVDVIEKLAVQILRALNYLHTRGIYHFDIKPQNVLVKMENGVPVTAKLIDFGLSGYSTPNKKVGTPAYMAPEVIQGGMLDNRTDLYSFGVALYKLLTGINPFTAKSLKEILNNHLNLNPRPPSEVNPDVPKYWDHIVERLIEKNPDNRYSQASLAIRDLNFLSGKKIEIETKDTKISYLPEKGTLIARDKEWQTFSKMFDAVFEAEAPSDDKLLIVEGNKGTGKSRLLSEMKGHSQLKSVPVKTLEQFESEERTEAYILQIDNAQVNSNRVLSLMQELANEKCLIVWTTDKAPENWTNTRKITLNNYSKIELKTYLEAVTGLRQAPESLIDEVFKRTQGNPLFVAEFIKILLDNNLLFDESGKWDATTFEDIKIDFDKIHIPTSVSEILLETYGQLCEPKQEILKWLAVNHEPLTADQLKSVTGIDAIKPMLRQLIEREVLQTPSTNRLYYFKNLLMRDVVYEKLSHKEAGPYHDKLATLYEERTDQKQKYLYHVGFGSHTAKSKKALFELSDFYMAQAKYDKAIEALLRLVKLSGHDDFTQSLDIHFKLGDAYFKASQFEKAITIHKNINNKLAQSNSDNTDQKIHSYGKIVESLIKQANLDEAETIVKEAQALIPDSKHNIIHELNFKNYHGYILLQQQEIEEAQALYKESRDAWLNNLNDEQREKVLYNRLYLTYFLQQDYSTAIKTCKENIDILINLNNPLELLNNYEYLGNSYHRLLETQEMENRSEIVKSCSESFLSCEKFARQINDYTMLYRALNGLGNLYNDEKDYEKALETYKRSFKVSQKIANTTNHPLDSLNAAFIAHNISIIHIEQKQYKEAYPFLTYAINTLENLDGYSPIKEENLVLIYVKLAEYYTQTNNFIKSHQALDKADKLLEDTDAIKHRAFWAKVRRAQTYSAQKNQEEASQCLDEAHELITDEHDREEYDTIKSVYDESFVLTGSTVDKVTGNTASVQSTTPVSDLKKIIEINQIINAQQDVHKLFKLVLDYALELTGAQSGYIMVLNELGALDIEAAKNTASDQQEQISMSVAKQSIEKGEIVLAADALADDRFKSSESIVLGELKSILCLPINSKGKTIGVFYLDNHSQTDVFKNYPAELLTAFSDQVGIALDKNKLVHKLQGKQKELTQSLEQTSSELEKAKTILHNEANVLQTKYAYTNIIAASAEMQKVFKILDKVTETNLSLFIYGASGTGKELIAKALHHNNGARKNKAFVAINCGAIPATLMESELFGHIKGSFTGADRDKKGLFEEANGGTLLLDEIGELDLQLQVKLLRVLQEGEVQRIGDTKSHKVDVRVLCASHKDLQRLVKQKTFREDLYYRLCQMKIDIPNLRDRTDDIPPLALHFVNKYRDQNALKEEIKVPPVFMEALKQYNWPGNVRELENLISVACALKEGNKLCLENIPPNYGMQQFSEGSFAQVSLNVSNLSMEMSQHIGTPIDSNNLFDPTKTWADYEALIFAKCYEANGKKKIRVCEKLDISHSTIYKKTNEYKLDDPNCPLYKSDFIYDGKSSLKEYVVKIFNAALAHHQNRPYAAIKQLGISQGYFYKIMKEPRENTAAL
ncbi:sigma 54-interacting transcriptional regulator [bacterium]|nr:sigma 54-interacting transcriptional regulator [bacterium]